MLDIRGQERQMCCDYEGRGNGVLYERRMIVQLGDQYIMRHEGNHQDRPIYSYQNISGPSYIKI
jgi:hypothetical protein